jgi:hypothetical protein
MAESERGGIEARRLTTNGQAKDWRRSNELALGGGSSGKVFFFLLRERGRVYLVPGVLCVGENRLLFGKPKRKEVFPTA